MHNPLFQELALRVQARKNCKKMKKPEWFLKHTARIVDLVSEHMPSGSGIDNGTVIDITSSKEDKLVFHFGYRHMNDNGMYTHWTEHKLVVTPSLTSGFDIDITNIDDSLEHLHEVFTSALMSPVGV